MNSETYMYMICMVSFVRQSFESDDLRVLFKFSKTCSKLSWNLLIKMAERLCVLLSESFLSLAMRHKVIRFARICPIFRGFDSLRIYFL